MLEVNDAQSFTSSFSSSYGITILGGP